jgi:tripartite-type tricarboxylate transporter receptor subunit TctC
VFKARDVLRFGLVWAFAMAIGGISIICATAQEVSLAGKQVDAITPTGPGGSGDAYLRYLGQFYTKYLPGNPTVVVRNMEGGGSVIGMNWFAANPQTDGTHFLLVAPSGRLTYLLDKGNENIKFEPSVWRAFLASPMGRVTYVAPSTGIKSVADLKGYKGDLVMGLQSATGSELPTLMSIEALGIKVRTVFGTDGGDRALAYQRGEFNINTDVTSAWLTRGPEMVKAGEAIPLFTFGFENEKGEIVRDPNFPDIPSWVEAYEILHGKKPDGPLMEAWLALFRNVTMSSRALVLPQGTPDNVYKAYVDASAALLEDPEFKATHAEHLGTYPQSTGEAAQRILLGSLQFSDQAREYVRNWLKESHDLELK